MKRKSKFHELVQTFKSTIAIFFAMIILLSAIVYWVYQHTSIDALVREIDEKKAIQSDLRLSNERLKREIARLESYSRIETIAKKDLELIDAKQAPYIFNIEQDSFQVELKLIKLKKDDKGIKFKIIKAGI